MSNTSKIENRILSIFAFACYVWSLASCGAAAYALVMLSLQTCGNLVPGFPPAASQF